jgi:hypothetical protein
MEKSGNAMKWLSFTGSAAAKHAGGFPPPDGATEKKRRAGLRV